MTTSPVADQQNRRLRPRLIARCAAAAMALLILAACRPGVEPPPIIVVEPTPFKWSVADIIPETGASQADLVHFER